MTGASSQSLTLARHEEAGLSPEHRRDVEVFVRHVAFASVLGLAISLVSWASLPGWRGASLAVGQGAVVCLHMLARRPRRWLVNLVLAGAGAGMVELAADLWLVRGTGTLRYAEGPTLFASPVYMPVAWLGMISAGLALGLHLRCRGLSPGASAVAVALALGAYIPLYEAVAARAGWWAYGGCSLLFRHVPHYIVFGEVLLAVPLVWLAERLRTARTLHALVLGVLHGAWIFASYALAHAALGGPP